MSAVRQVSALREHPLAASVPLMRPAEWHAFLEDIRERGILDPLRVAADGCTVLDGRHRLRAAVELGLTEVDVSPADCKPGDESGFMLRAALHRRHLSDDQRAMLAARLAEVMGAERRREQLVAAVESRWAKAPEGSGEPDTTWTGVVHPYPSRNAAERSRPAPSESPSAASERPRPWCARLPTWPPRSRRGGSSS